LQKRLCVAAHDSYAAESELAFLLSGDAAKSN
jgi:hypothetical protein